MCCCYNPGYTPGYPPSDLPLVLKSNAVDTRAYSFSIHALDLVMNENTPGSHRNMLMVNRLLAILTSIPDLQDMNVNFPWFPETNRVDARAIGLMTSVPRLWAGFGTFSSFHGPVQVVQICVIDIWSCKVWKEHSTALTGLGCICDVGASSVKARGFASSLGVYTDGAIVWGNGDHNPQTVRHS